MEKVVVLVVHRGSLAGLLLHSCSLTKSYLSIVSGRRDRLAEAVEVIIAAQHRSHEVILAVEAQPAGALVAIGNRDDNIYIISRDGLG